ncbi:MAG: hypothetical protein U0353_13505 [Sandaracinus sp.]
MNATHARGRQAPIETAPRAEWRAVRSLRSCLVAALWLTLALG